MSGQHTRRRDSKSYQVVFETKFRKYSLDGVDAGLGLGPKKPFIFLRQFSKAGEKGGGGRGGKIPGARIG